MAKVVRKDGDAQAIAEKVLGGDIRAAARLMRGLDDRDPAAVEVLRALFPSTGGAYIVGITGSPGAGKSSITDRLIAHYRKAGKTVGVVAIDPTSPFSGGAILGDRIRMQDHALDPGVFIRSLATRGSLGGLSRSSSDVIRVMDAMGKDVILVETVGVGQDEIDVASLAHTTIVVVVPGMGDDIQAIKAGILEVADVFAINKADRPGVDRTERELRGMIELRHVTMPTDHDSLHRFHATTPAQARADDFTWEPEIVRTIATRDKGFDDLVATIEKHRAHLEKAGGRLAREATRARAEFLAILRERLVASALERIAEEQGELDELATRIARREADPYTLVETIAARLR
ncbi:methylmalonyl Co-A mutase-associated GTPase MeaB [Vulgatibacter incomptus]|uniref:Putative periplasmic protein kinase ArgK n=1 Tax=Vulgatibacter incomptus TaxID=1391653 RepID=A0A0K1PBQ8_9BACT|nr:methylmalonyl Co-A mutase-associated GTPase MeaB [Vulgatibacter incomptus]AKU90960.1 putative periplasmic protein kinase ArgK [Vulgatibacter incomptus]